MLDHIRRLFELCLLKFQSDIAIWLSYVDFSLAQKAFPHVSNVYFKMLQFNNRDFLWIKFAKFEFEVRKSTESARKIFLKAITFHAESRQLWQEYFRFEMLYCVKIRRRFSILAGHEDEQNAKKKARDAIWNGELALIVFEHALKSHRNFEFAASFLPIAAKFDQELAVTVRTKIIQRIKETFGETEDFYNLLALEELHNYEICVSNFSGSDEKDIDEQRELKAAAVKRSLEVFARGCELFDNERMWAHYLSHRFRLLTEHGLADKESVGEVLFACERLWDERKVSCAVFAQWAQLYAALYANNAAAMKKLQRVCVEACDRWPADLPLHLSVACLLVSLPKVKQSDVGDLLEHCLTHKFARIRATDADEREKAVDLLVDFWELYLHFLLTNHCSERTLRGALDKLFRTASLLPRRFGEHMKCSVLQLLHDQLGVAQARAFFGERKNQSPISKEFFLKMLSLELAQQAENDSIARLYGELVHHFGQDSPDIWLEYIQFALDHRMVPQVGQIYANALKALDSSVVGRFVQGYALVTATPS